MKDLIDYFNAARDIDLNCKKSVRDMVKEIVVCKLNYMVDWDEGSGEKWDSLFLSKRK